MQNAPIIIGRIGAVHGLKGWLKINSYTRPKQNIFVYLPWLVNINKEWQRLEVDDYQQRGERLLAKIARIDAPGAARPYINRDLAVMRPQLPPLGEDKYYGYDLIGLAVFNQDNIRLGRISAITETGANDVLVIESSAGRRILIPLLRGIYIKAIDLDAGQVRVEWQADNDLSA